MLNDVTSRLARRIFVVYEHRLFYDILRNILGAANIAGAASRRDMPLTSMVRTIHDLNADVVIIEAQANESTAWHLLLAAPDVQRLLVLDLERGEAKRFQARSISIESVEDLLPIVGLG